MPGSRNAPSNRPGSQAKNWCFTINNPTPEDYALFPLPTALVQYCIYGREIGDDGTPHLQGYIQFRNLIRFNKVKELLPWSHLEVQRARSNSAAKEYCEKEDPTPHEEGEFTPSANDARGSSTANKREAYLSIRRGLPLQEIIDDHPEELSFIHSAARYAPPREEAAKVLYLFGKTGSGKTMSTLKVLQELELSFFKKMPGTHWFDGYTGQQVLVLEEFQSRFTLTKFLSMCDPHPPHLEIKGGTMPNRSPYIIICSNKSPLQQYTTVQEESPASFAAFLRRINTEVDCTGREYGDIEAHIRSFLTPYTL